MYIKRRDFIKVSGSAAVLAGSGLGASVWAGANPHVVVIGGGFGGATCARNVKRLQPSLNVTLVERDKVFHTCPFSNLVLGGLKTMDYISHGYDGLRAAGVEVIHDEAVDVDPEKGAVSLAGGQTLRYDRLVVSPGVDMKFDAVEGYDEAAAEHMPHAWKAGPQTELLRGQLEAMDDGGLVVIAPPGNPFRCPPGPYERACMIAHYLKNHKPKSKLLILDAKDKFSKQGLFMGGWEKFYSDIIEWVPGSEGGIVEAVEPASRTLITESGFTKHQADVVNFIPPQHAGVIAHRADLVDESGWCPVDSVTFESTRHSGIHVLGDACIAGAMPKSGFSASSQAKVCAVNLVATLAGESPVSNPGFVNTCYSTVAPEYGISVAATYRVEDGKIVSNEGGGVSPSEADADFRAKEAMYAQGWYESISADIWG